MRWKVAPEPELPKQGDKRIVKKFALFNVIRIDDTKGWMTSYWEIQSFGKRVWSTESKHFKEPSLKSKKKKHFSEM